MTKQIYDCFVVLVDGVQSGPAFRFKEDAQLWADDAVHYNDVPRSNIAIKQRPCCPLDMGMACRLRDCALKVGDAGAAHYYSTLTPTDIDSEDHSMWACLPSDYEIDMLRNGAPQP
jgi:hypothetical protein